jgi:hypothetical protein
MLSRTFSSRAELRPDTCEVGGELNDVDDGVVEYTRRAYRQFIIFREARRLSFFVFFCSRHRRRNRRRPGFN